MAAVAPSTVATGASPAGSIRPRDLRFELDPRLAASWHAGGAHVAHWYNALSLCFPAGEAFFIASVRRFEPQIQAPALRDAMQGFVGQEAMHAREHQRYNRALEAAGYPAAYLAKRVQNLTNWLARHLPGRTQLAITIAVEHITALLADATAAEAHIFAGCDPQYAAIWRWHALEEGEHRAVAFDVYRQVSGAAWRGYMRRAVAMIAVWLSLSAAVMVFTALLVARDGRLAEWRGWRALWRHLFAAPGALRGQLRGVAAYLHPAFHP